MAVISGIRVDSYTVVVETDDGDIKRLYIGNRGGVNVWPILNDEFRLKVFAAVFDN
jgi:hypothetical protein